MLTDNQGLAYQLTDETVLEALSTANAVFNAIVTPNARPPAPPRPGDNPDFTPHDVFKLAKESGGEVLKSAKAGESFQDMIERLRTRYSLHYRAPENAGSPTHAIRVDLSPQGRRKAAKAEVRSRTTYTLGR
jgi:hypothetical protein